ncbi:MAG: transposase zinc-binding domain-containing protein [Planctomycetes bacterium]|nr:transposase zinc-binding domain-containing protein [Planctomycetota bacterium]
MGWAFVERELRDFLACGLLALGCCRLHCDACGKDELVAFACKHRGFCPSCCGRRMADSAALIDEVLPDVPCGSGCCRSPIASGCSAPTTLRHAAPSARCSFVPFRTPAAPGPTPQVAAREHRSRGVRPPLRSRGPTRSPLPQPGFRRPPPTARCVNSHRVRRAARRYSRLRTRRREFGDPREHRAGAFRRQLQRPQVVPQH